VPPAIETTLAGLVAQAVIKKAQLIDARCFIFMVYFLVVRRRHQGMWFGSAGL